MNTKEERSDAPLNHADMVRQLAAMHAKIERESRVRLAAIDLLISDLSREGSGSTIAGDDAADNSAPAPQARKPARRKARRPKAGDVRRSARAPSTRESVAGLESVRAQVEALLPASGEVFGAKDIIAQMPGVEPKRVNDELARLARKGTCKRVGYGRYEIPRGGSSPAGAGRRKSAPHCRSRSGASNGSKRQETEAEPAGGREVSAASAGRGGSDAQLPTLDSMGNRVVGLVLDMPDEFVMGDVFEELQNRGLATPAEIRAAGAVSGPIKALRQAGFLEAQRRFGQDSSYVATDKLKALKRSKS